jgi:four helix bundle protein
VVVIVIVVVVVVVIVIVIVIVIGPAAALVPARWHSRSHPPAWDAAGVSVAARPRAACGTAKAALERSRTREVPMAQFEAFELAMELVSALRLPLEAIAKRDRDLECQIRRASASIALNIAEGAQRSGKDRLHHYRIAAGSAAEVHTALRIALAWRYVAPAELELAQALATRAVALLWRLTHPR